MFNSVSNYPRLERDCRLCHLPCFLSISVTELFPIPSKSWFVPFLFREGPKGPSGPKEPSSGSEGPPGVKRHEPGFGRNRKEFSDSGFQHHPARLSSPLTISHSHTRSKYQRYSTASGHNERPSLETLRLGTLQRILAPPFVCRTLQSAKRRWRLIARGSRFPPLNLKLGLA